MPENFSLSLLSPTKSVQNGLIAPQENEEQKKKPQQINSIFAVPNAVMNSGAAGAYMS